MDTPCPTSVPQERKKKLSVRPYNKSFIDQACLVKMAGYLRPSILVDIHPS